MVNCWTKNKTGMGWRQKKHAPLSLSLLLCLCFCWAVSACLPAYLSLCLSSSLSVSL